jgi:hypothetical protein
MWGWLFYFLSEGKRLAMFIAFRRPFPSTEFEPENLDSYGKHANSYISEDGLGLS